MVAVLFLSPTEWNQIEAAEKEELSVYKELSLGWGEEQTKIWWNEFLDVQAPHRAQGFLDATTSWSLDVHTMKCCQAPPQLLLNVLFHSFFFIYDSFTLLKIKACIAETV